MAQSFFMDLPAHPPNKDEIARMEPFEGLGMDQITVVTTRPQAESALEDLMASSEVGFDTESKPTFRKGEVSQGPHVLQFSTTERAYIFRSHIRECQKVVYQALQSRELIKIGFGLQGDLQQISQRFGIKPLSMVDLDRAFNRLGFQRSLGAKSAVAMLFQRKLRKSKSVTISNWAARDLTPKQLLYAANDAYAAIRIHHAMQAADRS